MISIVIPTKNDCENLKRLFKSLDIIQNEIEVIVVDSFSNDGTKELCYHKSYVKFIEAKSTAGKARNIGIKNSKHNIIAMLDADTEVTDKWLPSIKHGMKIADIVAGYSPDPCEKDMPRVPIVLKGQDITYPQCNIAYKRALFDEIGLLSESMNVAEDCEFHFRCAKANKFILYHPFMKVWHYERPNRKQWIKKQVKNGFGRYELEKIHPSVKHLSQHGLKLKGFIRLGFGAIGYIKARLGGNIDT